LAEVDTETLTVVVRILKLAQGDRANAMQSLSPQLFQKVVLAASFMMIDGFVDDAVSALSRSLQLCRIQPVYIQQLPPRALEVMSQELQLKLLSASLSNSEHLLLAAIDLVSKFSSIPQTPGSKETLLPELQRAMDSIFQPLTSPAVWTEKLAGIGRSRDFANDRDIVKTIVSLIPEEWLWREWIAPRQDKVLLPQGLLRFCNNYQRDWTLRRWISDENGQREDGVLTKTANAWLRQVRAAAPSISYGEVVARSQEAFVALKQAAHDAWDHQALVVANKSLAGDLC